MSFHRRSSFSGTVHHPSLHSRSSSSPSSLGEVRHLRSPSPIPTGLITLCTGYFSWGSTESPVSPTAISPATTIRPPLRRSSFSSVTTIQAPSQPIPISPPLSFLGSTYLAQRQSNLEWAIRHNDTELIRTERAAIERYKQATEAGSGSGADEAISTTSEGTGSAESFDIPIRDTSQAPTSSGLPRYNTGRRMSCLATYTGLPVPPARQTPTYSLALDGGGGGCGRGRYRYSSVPRSTSASPLRKSPSPSPPKGIHRPPTPYRSASGIVPLSRLSNSPSPPPSSSSSILRGRSPARPPICSSVSDPTGTSLGPSSPFSSTRDASISPSRITPPTRIIHGFHINSTPSTPSHSQHHSHSHSALVRPHESPSPPSSSHEISRGRAASVSMIGGLGCGNYQQERMELQASRDIEVLDREEFARHKRATKLTQPGGGGGGGGGRVTGRKSEGDKGLHLASEGVAKVRGGRNKEGKVAAAERLKKGYSVG